MLSEIAVLYCGMLVFQASFTLCNPTGNSALHNEQQNDIDPSNGKEDGYTVILKSPTHTLKVEVVDEHGNSKIQQMDIASEEEERPSVEVTTEAKEAKEQKKPRQRRKDEQKFKCDWRRLYRLYLSKRRTSGVNKGFSKAKRKMIREAFKTVCENPEDAITYLLDMISA